MKAVEQVYLFIFQKIQFLAELRNFRLKIDIGKNRR